MAVSFKVPASPKRNIFVIDEFKGVDLTNTGANIEETRSPNAENMIRYVPGKVRKRMGYEKDVLFGQDINVNYAKGTSSVDRQVVFTDEDTNEWVELYSLIQTLASKDGNAYTLYVEFDYTAEEDFYLITDDDAIPASEEWTHFSGTYDFAATDTLDVVNIKSATEQSLYIKDFSIMRGIDTSYEWSPAPNYFVERATKDPVFGCHVLKTGNFDGNRVANTNRALETSDSFVSYSASTTNADLYTLGESIYPGREVTIDFDYTLTGNNVDLKFYATGATRTTITTLSATATTTHKTVRLTPSSTYAYDTIQYATSSGSGTFEIKNFTLVYEKNAETYHWSAAPEDNGSVFHTEDIYLVGTHNYATRDNISNIKQTTNKVLTNQLEICDSTSTVYNFAHVSFDLNTGADARIDTAGMVVRVENSDGSLLWKDTSTTSYKNKHFDLYIATEGSDKYIRYITVVFNLVANAGCYTAVSNITVNEVTPRTDFNISSKNYLYHVGSDFYYRPSDSSEFRNVYSGANSHLSSSWQFNKRLYILDGKNIYSYGDGEETAMPIGEEEGYIPTVTIAKAPTGGGQSYEPLNMLQPGFIETFIGTADATAYSLSFGGLDDTPVRAWRMDVHGTWNELVEDTNFTVNRGTGVVTFNTAPGEPQAVPGEPNVKIQAYRTVKGYRDRVTKCTIGTLFGVNGAQDRLFISGNPDYPNWDFYSQRNDPTYFPDTWYSTLGSETSTIVGYAKVNNYLATFNDGADPQQTVFIREGDWIVDEETGEGNAAFKLINTLQGNGVVAPYAFGNLQTEPLFLTNAGIFAITAQDITGEKYSQNRSFYLNGKLLKEDNLQNAVATVYDDMYILALNNKLYILDGLQATRTDRSEPYSTRQYVAFYCSKVPAVCLWNDNDNLCFGTADGKICKFNKDIEDLTAYNDDGKEIYCCWETPDLDGKLFYKNKTFRYFAIRMMKALRTSVKLWSQKLGNWTFIKEDLQSGLAFDFEHIDFEYFSFSTDRSEKVVHTKVRVKKVDKARFRVENGKLNEPFGLFDLALEYIESGNYKG